MKFRVSGKDAGIFAIFVILLFYLCCLITSNVYSLGETGSFSGLDPFPGLVHSFAATMIIFVIFLIIIFSGVSSYIFERKKGVGFEISEKSDKGYSRWAKEKEIKLDKDVEIVDPLAKESQYAGIPLVNDGKKLWVDNGEYHNLVIGSTGSGKSQTIVEPMVELLIKKGESMIITDPKGELYKAASNYMRERGYNVVVLNFREPQNGNAWNPLTLPYRYYKDGNFDKAAELLDDVALNILYDPSNKSGDPFWEKSAADYFSGLALGLFEDADEKQINLNSINLMSTVGEDKFAASNYIKEYFTMKGEASSAYVFASNTINSPSDTKGGILSVFRQKIRLFSTRENLSEMLSYSDFDMQKIGKEKTAVFIVIHDEKTTYHGLATIFIKQCYETLIDVAQKNGGKLPFRTNFILDEFANMPPLKDVTTMVTAARSRAIRFTFIIQNFAQLKSVYGDNDAETIKGNCGNLVYLLSTELAALEEISKMCGEVKSSDKDKTASTPLVTVTDLQKLKLFDAIIIRWRKPPFKTTYTPNFKMNWGHDHTEASYPERKKEQVQTFDVKTFVKEKKRSNMMNSLESKSGGSGGVSPFGGGSSFGGGNVSPFGGSTSPFGGGTSSSDDMFGSGGLGGFGGGIDLDAMMKDIDKKIAELDAEEERKKKEEEAKKKEENVNNIEIKNNIELPSLDIKKEESSSTFKNDVIKDVLPIDTKVNTSIEQEKIGEEQEKPVEKKEQLSIDIDKKENNYNVFGDYKTTSNLKNNEISIGNEKANIAVATSSPIEDDFEMNDSLPKVQNTTIIQPNYVSGSVVKTNDKDDFNIYDAVPNIMNSVKENKEEVNDVISVPKDKLGDIDKKVSEFNIYSKDVDIKPVREEVSDAKMVSKNDDDKPNVNIDPDKVVIKNNMISDDEFFDDFFGDD